MPAQMLVTTTEGFYPARTQVLISADPDEVAAFLQKNNTTYGVTIQYAVAGRKVYEVVKRGRVGKRLAARLIARLGASEWHFSWAFAGQRFRLADDAIVPVETIDLLTEAEVLEAWTRGRTLDRRPSRT